MWKEARREVLMYLNFLSYANQHIYLWFVTVRY